MNTKSVLIAIVVTSLLVVGAYFVQGNIADEAPAVQEAPAAVGGCPANAPACGASTCGGTCGGNCGIPRCGCSR